ncbi:hypothetical protein AKJ16_DCAP06644 [Drosera capensis]
MTSATEEEEEGNGGDVGYESGHIRRRRWRRRVAKTARLPVAGQISRGSGWENGAIWVETAAMGRDGESGSEPFGGGWWVAGICSSQLGRTPPSSDGLSSGVDLGTDQRKALVMVARRWLATSGRRLKQRLLVDGSVVASRFGSEAQSSSHTWRCSSGSSSADADCQIWFVSGDVMQRLVLLWSMVVSMVGGGADGP